MSLLTAAYFRVFEPLLLFNKDSRKTTARALRAARIATFPEWYLSLAWLGAMLATVAAWVLLGALAFATGDAPAWAAAPVVAAAGVAAGTLAYLGALLYPRVRAAGRARAIDAEFPHVAILCYALARGGMGTLDVFRAVAQERHVFGEISLELGLVLRETEWMGQDLIAGMEEVAGTTPSSTLKGFLEGLVTILKSGADPRDYLRRQAETQLAEAELRMQKELDQAALLAEAYVSGLLVLPLLLIVILSVLSALGGGNEGFIPLVVFVLIPFGTAAYLLLAEILLPPEGLSVPRDPPGELSDFGIEATRTRDLLLPPPPPPTLDDVAHDLGAREGAADARLGRRLRVEWTRRRGAEALRGFTARVIVKPVDAIEVSGTLALLVFLAGGLVFWLGGVKGKELVLGATGLALLTLAVAILPVSVFHEMRLRRARSIERALPETVSRLSSFNERGISLPQAFRILAHSSKGPLSGELRALERDLAWNGSLGNALRRLRERVHTRSMARLACLFERAAAATGNLKEVLDIAAQNAGRQEALLSRKAQSMSTYVVVIYVVFAVFLYVIYMVTDLFYQEGGLAAGLGAAGGAAGLDPDAAQVLFYHAALLQAGCCGLVAGKLGEGHLLSGLKHALVLAAVAWLTFRAGVFA